MDKRIKNTTKSIKQALFRLLEEKPLSKITVTELCREAGVNRATFYLHYTDIYDLLDKIELSYVEEMRENNTRLGIDGKVDFLWIVELIKRHSDFYRITFMNNIHTRFMDEFHNELRTHYFKIFENRTTNEHMYTFEFLRGGVDFVIAKWINSGMKESTTEIARILRELYINLHDLS